MKDKNGVRIRFGQGNAPKTAILTVVCVITFLVVLFWPMFIAFYPAIPLWIPVGIQILWILLLIWIGVEDRG
jgi:hypothetical protein